MVSGGRRRLDADGDAAPADLRWCQAGAALLRDTWAETAARIGGGVADLAAVAEARPSAIHGEGLFATRDLEMGALVALYRPDLTVDENGEALLIDGGDAEYFASADRGPLSQVRWVYPPTLTTSAVPDARPPRFWVAANPNKPTTPGWLAHLVNDGATCADAEDVERYCAATAAAKNACLVPLCVPLVGVVLSDAVAAGEEILVSYGHDAWLGAALEASHPEPVAAALRKRAAEYAGLTLLASQKYGRELQALATFVRTGDIDPPSAEKKPARRRKKGFG